MKKHRHLSPHHDWWEKNILIAVVIIAVLLLFDLQATGKAVAFSGCCLATCQETSPAECPDRFLPDTICADVPQCDVGCCVADEYCYENYLRGSCSGIFAGGSCISQVACTLEKPSFSAAGSIGIPTIYTQTDFLNAVPSIAKVGTPILLKILQLKANSSFLQLNLTGERSGERYQSSVFVFDDGWHGDDNPHDGSFAGIWQSSEFPSFTGFAALKYSLNNDTWGRIELSSTDCLPFFPEQQGTTRNVFFLTAERGADAVSQFKTKAGQLASAIRQLDSPPAAFYVPRSLAAADPREFIQQNCPFAQADDTLIILTDNTLLCAQEGQHIFLPLSFFFYTNLTQQGYAAQEVLSELCSHLTTSEQLKTEFLMKQEPPTISITGGDQGPRDVSAMTLSFVITDSRDGTLPYALYADAAHPWYRLVSGNVTSGEEATIRFDVPDGQHSLLLETRDREGHYAITPPIVVEKEASGITVEIISPEGHAFLESPSITFVVHHQESSWVNYTFQADGNITLTGLAMTEMPLTIQPDFSSGNHLFSILAEDEQGKMARSALQYLVIGTTDAPEFIAALPEEES